MHDVDVSTYMKEHAWHARIFLFRPAFCDYDIGCHKGCISGGFLKHSLYSKAKESSVLPLNSTKLQESLVAAERVRREGDGAGRWRECMGSVTAREVGGAG